MKLMRDKDGDIIATNGYYNFTMYLSSNLEDQENTWYCYAWPVEKDITGIRVFVFSSYNHFVAANNTQKYSGDKKPKYNAAISPEVGIIMSGHRGYDEELWVT
ncbi:hypothetical protein [Candidatus Uabimicrobium sp. HlEnr_7]|uniref:hypothetical protein n=1 Tax=Candidatus Uabimicrobium helgolandensis TaxID=3095367 RepID=UPI003556026C